MEHSGGISKGADTSPNTHKQTHQNKSAAAKPLLGLCTLPAKFYRDLLTKRNKRNDMRDRDDYRELLRMPCRYLVKHLHQEILSGRSLELATRQESVQG